ncbi:cation diffusion facilitator family transporter [Tuberibacillus sp. Marseille-P3662]|uniref:cation diffusion facilitator family transporter n=1 Tax=Tuberibacillus sp. Marseille-P3662 TaxID=1965358 RepID=UPI000A1C9FC3|nr:cation diffusion facilitator family transporter [Tuberibacillus sp. Marseille-P3662]
MSHEHGHDHSHNANKKALLISFILIAAFMLVEVIGGFLTNSLALLSDAGHMLSDAVSLAVGLLAFKFGEKNADLNKTYGYKRFEILAALFNGIVLILISLYIIYEAYQRFLNPPDVASTGMLVVAIIGLIVNIAVAWILMQGESEENLNLRAAFLHVIGDLLGSVGAIIAALLILFFNWGIADPIASVVVAVLVLVSGWRVTRDACHVLMEGTPENVDIDAIINCVQSISGISKIHDLHVWSITSGQNALSCHAVVNENLTIRDGQEILRDVEHQLQHQGIGHVTIQLEDGSHPHKDSLTCEDSDQGHHEHDH